MKNRQVDHLEKMIGIMKELKRKYPTSTMGRHMTLAFADYNDTFSISDKEFCFALEKYNAELEMNTVSDTEIQQIIDDTTEMFTMIESEDEDPEDDQ